MTDRTPSAMTLKCFILASIVMLDGPFAWSNEFDVDAYERARKHSIFPAEFTMSATELSTRSNGIKNGNTVSYTRKHERKKLTLTVVESSNDQSRLGYSVTAIKTESAYASAQRFPGKPDDFLDQVTINDEEAEQSFSSVLPIFAPYSIDGTDILKTTKRGRGFLLRPNTTFVGRKIERRKISCESFRVRSFSQIRIFRLP